ncbi:MAG: sigma-E factor negative regulatory protein [Pseudomonadota bacterium]
MNDTTSNHDPGREQLSAFLDDELAPDEARFLLRRLEADPDLSRHLHHYAAIGEVLRGHSAPIQMDLVERVQRAIHGESIPQAAPTDAAEAPASEVASGGLMPLARVAAAAAVAAVVLVTVLPRPDAGPSLVDAGETALEETLFPTVPPVTTSGADGVLVEVPGNASFASYLLKHTSAVGPTVRPDFVAAQRAYDHLQPTEPSTDGAEEEAATQDVQQ